MREPMGSPEAGPDREKRPAAAYAWDALNVSHGATVFMVLARGAAIKRRARRRALVLGATVYARCTCDVGAVGSGVTGWRATCPHQLPLPKDRPGPITVTV